MRYFNCKTTSVFFSSLLSCHSTAVKYCPRCCEVSLWHPHPKCSVLKSSGAPDLSISLRERVCDKACLPARGSMKVTDIISQSDSQCLTPGYLSAHNLTERGDCSMRGFLLSLCYPSTTSSLHLVTCLSFAELLWWWAVHIDATQIL